MKASSDDVKKLREITGAGMMVAKKALEEAENFEAARVLLRKKGQATLAKKSTRAAKEGLIVSYVHAGGKVGVLLELNCETDFVARNEEFKKLADELALQIAAVNPSFISREEVPQDMVEKEKEIYLEQIKDKPENVRAKIVEGKLDKFYEEVCLLEQVWVRDQDKKIKDLIAEQVNKLGENIQVRRFTRFALGSQ
ncbi:MAG: elongation factor Ts [Candidatus Doudnabacteria bacterium]|nr:elongation factor Ts [Candidatus Doudnabacteria bacterium]